MRRVENRGWVDVEDGAHKCIKVLQSLIEPKKWGFGLDGNSFRATSCRLVLYLLPLIS